MVKIDILYLVDRFEEFLKEGWRIPFTSLRVVDEQQGLRLIEQMRVSVPEELKKAKRAIKERDRILAEARRKADRIVARAEEQALNMVQEHELKLLAEKEAQALLEQARREAEAFRAEADDYALEVLRQLETQLDSFLTTVRNGIKALQELRGKKRRRRRPSKAPKSSD